MKLSSGTSGTTPLLYALISERSEERYIFPWTPKQFFVAANGLIGESAE